MTDAAEIAAWLAGGWTTWILVLARIAGLCLAAPAFATPALGWRIRVALAVLLTVAVAPTLPMARIAPGPALVAAATVEVLAGAALGLAAGLVVAGARQAGEIVGLQAGLSAAALFDPEAGDELTAMGHLYGLVALATYLALDGPLASVRGVVASYRVVPPGGIPISPALAREAFARVGLALELAVRAAAPAALALTMAGLAMGLLGRAAPSLQLVSLALPVRSGLGLVLAFVGLAGLVATLATAWDAASLADPAWLWPAR